MQTVTLWICDKLPGGTDVAGSHLEQQQVFKHQ